MPRKPKTPPDPEAFKRELLRKPKRYIICRDIRHAWQPLGGFHYHVQYVEGASSVFVARDFQCIRCESQKKEIYLERKDGKLERYGTTKYDYSEEYKLPNKPVGVKPQEIIRQAAYEADLASQRRPQGLKLVQ